MLSKTDLRKLKSRIAYSIQKNSEFIDFSGIGRVNELELRYLLKDIITLQKHYKLFRENKEVKDE